MKEILNILYNFLFAVPEDMQIGIAPLVAGALISGVGKVIGGLFGAGRARRAARAAAAEKKRLKAIGFKKEDVNHCIEICETLIREEVEWWKERTDLRKNSALKVPSLVEYYSWYIIWRLCKYHKLVTHPLHNFASKKQSILKKNLPQNTPIISIKLNLNMTQVRDLYVG